MRTLIEWNLIFSLKYISGVWVDNKSFKNKKTLDKRLNFVALLLQRIVGLLICGKFLQ